MAYKIYKNIPNILVFWFIYLMIDSVEVSGQTGFFSKAKIFFGDIINGNFDIYVDSFFSACIKFGLALIVTHLILSFCFSLKSEKS